MQIQESKLSYKKVGHIQGAHGPKGELLVFTPSGDASWASKLKSIELRHPKKQESTVFKVLKAVPYKDGLRILIEGISDRTQAEKFKGFDFLIDGDHLISQPGEVIYLSEIDGFEVLQRDEMLQGDPRPLGRIIGFSSNGAQDLLRIENSKGVFEAPFVSAFIVKIDFLERKIFVNFPSGLQD
ncbi:MAG: 16S rRNA processing protein RimM [Bdellovibrionales bacterium]|nr:16S rRNA processing protein RimM [Bdellovibrionales bacterium]